MTESPNGPARGDYRAPEPDAANQPVFPAEPWYLLVFEATVINENYQPITFGMNAPANVTQPHGFDREMIPPLDAVWFTLHLPRRVT
jgi:hypothetical protein